MSKRAVKQEEPEVEIEPEVELDGIGVDEPDWDEFVFNETFDSPGHKQAKMEEFMHTFIRWRMGRWTPPTNNDPAYTARMRSIRGRRV